MHTSKEAHQTSSRVLFIVYLQGDLLKAVVQPVSVHRRAHAALCNMAGRREAGAAEDAPRVMPIA